MNANLKGKKFHFLDHLNLAQEVVNKLTIYFYLVIKGSNNVLITPIGIDHNPDKLLKEWDEIFDQNINKINSNLRNLEDNNRNKFGPRSIAKPWKDRVDDVASYFKPKTSTINQLRINEYIPFVRSLRPLSVNKALKYIKNNTNAGLPFYTKKGGVKQQVAENLNTYLDRKDPAVLFTRTQEGNKTRTVWGYPLADTLNEMLYYRPLLNYQLNQSWRSALKKPEDVDLALTEMIDLIKHNDDKDPSYVLVSIDFSTYDASVSETLIKAAFYYIKSLFQPKFWKELDYICDRFTNISIVTPTGVFKGKHGVPSGSTFTNEVDSIVQYLVSKLSGVDIIKLQIQGDDGVYLIRYKDLNGLIKSFEQAGLKVNKDKSYTSSDYAVYLQNLYDDFYRRPNNRICGIYPTYRALLRIIYQERFTDLEEIGLSGKEYFSIRAISILENCKYHPLFEDLVRFILSKDKYNLEFSQEGVKKYMELISQTKGSVGIIDNQYGDQLTGINNFETVKLIRRLKSNN